ncbi:MAG: aldehyde ferredoxin oxidoreductase family protein [Clostridiales bacterium]|nr:aldehyde ferredoxin oxidoreductase family protein [Clostridiales bacterium]MCF8022886.1 aldehyde ferredoxin oxidoreductase family protein [Clostridiales bacterium]
MIYGGFWGKLLRVDLTNKITKIEEIQQDLLKNFVGGALLGAKLLYDEVLPYTEALGAGNKLIYTVGPVTGTAAPCASRLNIATKSPLTGALANSLSGGFFPVEMKKAGFDAIVIEGKAKEPVYLYITDDKVNIKSAKKYWGLDTMDTQLYLKEDLKDHNLRISCIGPAGENLSLMSCIINEARAAGRKGIGAIMGSKNLKAVVTRGTKEVTIKDPGKFKNVVKEILENFKKCEVTYPFFSKTGTVSTIEGVSELGVFPENNFRDTGVNDWSVPLGSSALSKYNQTRNPCYRCPICCSQVRMVREGKYAGISTEGPEYETIYSLGSMLGIDNPEVIIAADRLCDQLGLDTISAGVTIAMAMELYEKGIFTDTAGMELTFGNHDIVLPLLRMLAYKEGFAKIFADGTKCAAQRISEQVNDYAMEVKGLELPAYDVRGLKSQGLNFATSYTGADHNRGYAIQEVSGIQIPHPVERLNIKGKGALTKFNQDFAGTYDVLTMCQFPMQSALVHIAQRVSADLLTVVTGFAYTEEDLWKLGERLNNICRMFNVREGFTRKDDVLPKRIMEEPIKQGLSKGERISQANLDSMLDEYYLARGWDMSGIPTPEKLKELNLEFTIKDLNRSANN